MTLVIRTTANPESLSAAVRAAIRQLDSQAAVEQMQSMGKIVTDSLSARRFQLNLLIAFALVGLILTSLGVYGVLAFTTARRTGEIGIRMALGARPNQILSATLRQGMGPVLLGIAAGLSLSVALSRVLYSVLFYVRALDALVYFETALVLLCVAVLACFIPARRAARLNPMEALHR
jgi:putative ABC transport system permease protein